MSKNNTIRVSLLVLVVFVLANIVYAAVPQSTVRTTGGGITTYVGHYGNFTLGLYQGVTERLDASGEATFTNLTLTGPFLNGYNITDHLGYPQQPASYIIFTDGTNYYAKNGTTGQIDYSGTQAEVVINSAKDALTNGGDIFLKQGIYWINYTGAFYVGDSKYCLNWNQSNVNLYGEENATLKVLSGVDIGGVVDTTDFLAMIWVHADNIRISGITFDANQAAVTAGQEIPIFHYQASYNIEVDHCISKNHYKWFIFGDSGPEWWNIHENTIYGPYNGISIHNGEKQIIIKNNNIGYTSYCGVGIEVDSVTNVIISENIIRRPGNYGIHLYDIVLNVQILNNQINGKSGGGTASGIKLESKDTTASAVNNTLIMGNIFTTLTTALNNGVLIDDAWCFNTTIQGNIFNGPTTPVSDSGTWTTSYNNEGYVELGDIRLNGADVEMYNSTAWVRISP